MSDFVFPGTGNQVREGLTKRELYAMVVTHAIISSDRILNVKQVAGDAVRIADALEAALKQ